MSYCLMICSETSQTSPLPGKMKTGRTSSKYYDVYNYIDCYGTQHPPALLPCLPSGRLRAQWPEESLAQHSVLRSISGSPDKKIDNKLQHFPVSRQAQLYSVRSECDSLQGSQHHWDLWAECEGATLTSVRGGWRSCWSLSESACSLPTPWESGVSTRSVRASDVSTANNQ